MTLNGQNAYIITVNKTLLWERNARLMLQPKLAVLVAPANFSYSFSLVD